MDDNEYGNNKPFVSREDNNKDIKKEPVISKCHYLENKYFIVFHKSITDQLSIFKSHEDLYFEQKLGADGSIVFRRYNFKR